MKKPQKQRNRRQRLTRKTSWKLTDWQTYRQRWAQTMNKQWEHNLKLMTSSVDRINGKCTENVGEVRDNSVKDWSAASLSPHTSALSCEMQVDVTYKSSGGYTHLRTHAGSSITSAPRYVRKGIYHLSLGYPCVFPTGHAHKNSGWW